MQKSRQKEPSRMQKSRQKEFYVIQKIKQKKSSLEILDKNAENQSKLDLVSAMRKRSE